MNSANAHSCPGRAEFLLSLSPTDEHPEVLMNHSFIHVMMKAGGRRATGMGTLWPPGRQGPCPERSPGTLRESFFARGGGEIEWRGQRSLHKQTTEKLRQGGGGLGDKKAGREAAQVSNHLRKHQSHDQTHWTPLPVLFPGSRGSTNCPPGQA